MHYPTTQGRFAMNPRFEANSRAAMSPEARHIAALIGVTEQEYSSFRAGRAATGGAAAMSPEARHIAALMGVTEGEYVNFRAGQAAPTLDPSGDGVAQLLPAGEFRALDGRPGDGRFWRISDLEGQALAAEVNAVAARTPIVVDYDHQTLTTRGTGNLAPAAGWIRRVQWLAGKGLMAAVEWTERARAFIRAREYRYISPVIQWDAASGRITGLLMVSLVNHPALLGMDAVLSALSGLPGKATDALIAPARLHHRNMTSA